MRIPSVHFFEAKARGLPLALKKVFSWRHFLMPTCNLFHFQIEKPSIKTDIVVFEEELKNEEELEKFHDSAVLHEQETLMLSAAPDQ